VIMGAAIDESYRGKLSVTVVAAANIMPRRVVAQPAPAKPLTFPRPSDATPAREPQMSATRATPLGSSVTTSHPVTVDAPKPEPVAAQKSPSKPKQETLPLEGVSRGRFDKSEPTLYNGEDLDVPTFIRRAVSLKR
jgi:cell division protein FtsZ